ncbi:hypothetical protein SAMN04490243_2576 [Robiginitalea myxolifaciens]|uniref:PH domain-containing protein n=1 Tax=Robiginitalea myxolifaciens TaxID=400055 RepID=A0A1I6HD50_9FLAO|nr:hypothetical protein [Robiginitalea myxolifaciens]SFR52304.1 hypothetical protein SAMN04490243_2576 [Robiginitalea myxolifaciens]
MGYKKTQIGTLFIVFMCVFVALISIPAFLGKGVQVLTSTPFLVSYGLIFIILLLFFRMQLELTPEGVRITYGIGIIRIFLPIDKVHRTESISTKWYWGLGIRYTPEGVLYNIQGLQAVRVYYEVGGQKKSVMLGTAAPEDLAHALEKAFP